MAAAATAMKNRLKRNAELGANRRHTGDTVFLAAEQASRHRYNEFTKLSREFSKAYPNEFKNFLMARSRGIPVARQSFGLPRHTPPVTVLSGQSMPPIQLPDFRSVTSSGRIPSAQHMESSRMPPKADTLAALGIRLD